MTRDEKIAKALSYIMEVEGGEMIEYDGTLSNHGLNQKTFDEYNRRNNKPLKSVREATFDEYKDVAKKEFLGRHGLNKISDDMILPVLDFAIQSGPSQTALEIQRLVGTKDDGIIGPNSIEKINEFVDKNGEEGFVNGLMDRRKQFLIDLSSERDDILRDMEGLNNRVEKIRLRQLQNIGGNR